MAKGKTTKFIQTYTENTLLHTITYGVVWIFESQVAKSPSNTLCIILYLAQDCWRPLECNHPHSINVREICNTPPGLSVTKGSYALERIPILCSLYKIVSAFESNLRGDHWLSHTRWPISAKRIYHTAEASSFAWKIIHDTLITLTAYCCHDYYCSFLSRLFIQIISSVPLETLQQMSNRQMFPGQSGKDKAAPPLKGPLVWKTSSGILRWGSFLTKKTSCILCTVSAIHISADKMESDIQNLRLSKHVKTSSRVQCIYLEERPTSSIRLSQSFLCGADGGRSALDWLCTCLLPLLPSSISPFALQPPDECLSARSSAEAGRGIPVDGLKANFIWIWCELYVLQCQDCMQLIWLCLFLSDWANLEEAMRKVLLDAT